MPSRGMVREGFEPWQSHTYNHYIDKIHMKCREPNWATREIRLTALGPPTRADLPEASNRRSLTDVRHYMLDGMGTNNPGLRSWRNGLWPHRFVRRSVKLGA